MTPFVYLSVLFGNIGGSFWFGGIAAGLCTVAAVVTLVLWKDAQ